MSGKVFLYVSGTEEYDRNDLKSQFGQYGSIKKIFIPKEDAQYAKIYYDSAQITEEAFKLAVVNPNIQYTVELRLDDYKQKNERDSLNNSSSNSVAGFCTFDDSDIMDGQMLGGFVDIHGRDIDALVNDENNQIYISFSDIRKTGFRIFNKENFSPAMVSKNDILNEFKLYMLSCAKEFLITNSIKNTNTHDITKTIEECERQMFGGAEAPKNNSPARKVSVESVPLQKNGFSKNYPENKENQNGKSKTNGSSTGGLRMPHNGGQNQNNRGRNEGGSDNEKRRNRNGNGNRHNGPRDYFGRDTTNDDKSIEKMKLSSGIQKVKATFIEKENVFWGQLVENEETLLDILALSQDLSSECKTVLNPKPGMFYLIQSPSDQLWYRVKLIKEQAPNLSQVHYIDFGNLDTIETPLKVLPESLKKYPEQSCRIVFRTEDYGTPVVLNKTYELREIKCFEDETHVVATSTSEMGALNKESLKSSKVEELPKQALIPKTPKVEIFTKVPEILTDLPNGDKVMIISNDDTKFYVRNKALYSRFIDLGKLIADYTARPLEKYQIGQIILISKECELQLHRAKIQELDDSLVNVKYIDFNTADILSTHAIKSINEEIATFPSTLAELSNVEFDFSKLGENEIEQLEKFINNKIKFDLVKINDGYNLLLDNKSLSSLIFPAREQKICKLVPAESTDVKSCIKETKIDSPKNVQKTVRIEEPEKVVSQKAAVQIVEDPKKVEKVVLEPTKEKRLLYDSMKFFEVEKGTQKFMVTCYNSLDDITLACMDSDEYMDLLAQVSDVELTDNTPYEPVLMEMCFGLYEDGWYRCAIVDSDVESGTFECLFVEFGNTVTLKTKDLRKLSGISMEIPVLGLSCKYNQKVSRKKASCDKIRKHLLPNRDYDIEILSSEKQDVGIEYVIDFPPATATI